MRWAVSITLRDGMRALYTYPTRKAAREADRILRSRVEIALRKKRRILWMEWPGTCTEVAFRLDEVATAKVVDLG